VSAQTNQWPRLDYAADRQTTEAMHLALQLIGKLPTRLLPWENHGWHVALRVGPRGFVTRPMPGGGRQFTAALDVHTGAIHVACDNGTARAVPVAERTVAQVHADLVATLEGMGLPAPLWGGPNELPDPVRFADDQRPRAWDADAALRLHGAFLGADRVFNRFRARYRGKSSPSQLFWGSFDLAVTRFSGRPAPVHPGGIPNLPDAVTREAYSNEEVSAGFWPGGNGVEEAAFYAYAYPTPAGLSEARAEPDAAEWNATLGEFVLPYAAVRAAADPDAEVLRFLKSTWRAASGLLDWPAGLECAEAVGHPPASSSSS
jgi:hypothetical protein